MEGKSSSRNKGKGILFLAIFLGAWFLILFFLDMPVFRYFQTAKLPRFIKENAEFFNSYAWPAPLVLLTLTAAISAGAARWKMLLHLILGLALAGAGVWAGKLILARQRPHSFSGLHWKDSLMGFFPGWANTKFQSFPSGDAATGFAVSFILARYFPKHRFVLYTLAVGCAASRVVLQWHFLSDVVFGALIGYLSARFVSYLSTSGPGKGKMG